MFTILIALLAGLLAGGGSHLLVGALWKQAHLWEDILIGTLAAVGVGVLLLRRAGARLEPIMKTVEKHMAGGRRELALKALRDSMEIGKWNPLVPAQLYGQIGVLEYAGGSLDEAEVALTKATRYPWHIKAYLGCVHFKRRNEKKMRDAFETALSVGDKEGIVYTLYAHCLIAQGKKDDAVKVIERGLKKIPGDHRLEANLELAKEGKKLKTAPYGDDWSRFLLEGPPQPSIPGLPKGMRGFAAKPGFRQRPQRRK